MVSYHATMCTMAPGHQATTDIGRAQRPCHMPAPNRHRLMPSRHGSMSHARHR